MGKAMQVYCQRTARIRHSATGNIYEIESDELDWDAVSGDERQMGPEIHYEAMVDHPELGKLTVIAHPDGRGGRAAGKCKPFKVRRMAWRAPMVRRLAVSMTDLMSA